MAVLRAVSRGAAVVVATFAVCFWRLASAEPPLEQRLDTRVAQELTPATSGTRAPAPEVPRGFAVTPNLEGPQPVLEEEDPLVPAAFALGLRPLPDGSFAYEGTPGERFDALIQSDGVVRLLPESLVQVKAESICAVVVCVRPNKSSNGRTASNRAERWVALAGAYAATLTASAFGGDPNADISSPQSAIHQNRAWEQTPVQLSNPAAAAPGGVAPLGGAGGRYGYLPAPNRQMAAFLDRTFDFRLALAVAAWQLRCEEALAQIPSQLLTIWSDEALSYPERRAEILYLWDSLEFRTVDTPLDAALGTEVDTHRVRAAQDARDRILKFVRTSLPERSPWSFTRKELRVFNDGRFGSSLFRPYKAPRRRPFWGRER